MSNKDLQIQNLYRKFKIFNEKEGKLRVVLTHRCQLNCRFCHKEGVNRDRNINFSYKDFGRVINSFYTLGGTIVNLTGGEPLLYTSFIKLLRRIKRPRNSILVLSTNGVNIEKLTENLWIKNKLTSLLISLHSFSEETFRNLQGGKNIEKVKNNILLLKELGYPIQINFTLTKLNIRELKNVIEFAVKNEFNLKILDLLETPWNKYFYRVSYINPEKIRPFLEKIANKKLYSNTMGVKLIGYKVKNSFIILKDRKKGRLETEMCTDCKVRKYCSEGVYALRVSDGYFKPCLLRKDLEVSIDNKSSLSIQLLSVISKMVGDPRKWKYVAK